MVGAEGSQGVDAAWLYIVECLDDSYYTGVTTKVIQRMVQHEFSEICSYVSKRGFKRLLFTIEFPSLEDAARAEKQVKGWSRAKKEALMRGDFDMIHELSVCHNSTHHGNRSKEKPMTAETANKTV
ncbi:MAG: GIY-YIG nuclease family protein [Candidatus Zixiibacteriota bacterium]